MKKFNYKFIFLFFFEGYAFLIPFPGKPQYTSNEKKMFSIQLIDSLFVPDIKSFQIDPIGNLYVLKNNNEIIKKNEDGKEKNFKSKVNSGLTSLDVSNPYKIMIFYDGILEVIFLDNYLSQTSKINLSKINLEGAKLVCSSSNNNLWVYDEIQIKIYLFNLIDNKIMTQIPLDIVLKEKDFQPQQLIEHNNILFLKNGNKNIITFDIFGNYKSTLPLSVEKNFILSDDFIFYIDEQKIKIYNFYSFETYTLSTPTINPDMIGYYEKKIYIMGKTGIIYIFRLI